MSWFSKELGTSADGFLTTKVIVEAFPALLEEAGRPDDMVVFSKDAFDASSGLWASTLYFSPGAERLAQAFAARPCWKPSRERLCLLSGGERAWEQFFPSPGEAES